MRRGRETRAGVAARRKSISGRNTRRSGGDASGGAETRMDWNIGGAKVNGHPRNDPSACLTAPHRGRSSQIQKGTLSRDLPRPARALETNRSIAMGESVALTPQKRNGGVEHYAASAHSDAASPKKRPTARRVEQASRLFFTRKRDAGRDAYATLVIVPRPPSPLPRQTHSAHRAASPGKRSIFRPA